MLQISHLVSCNYSQKLLDSAKKTTTDAIKTASKRTAEATGDLIGNKIADKITKKYFKELHSKELHSQKNSMELP